MSHRTARPTFPRPGAGRHREPRVLAPPDPHVRPHGQDEPMSADRLREAARVLRERAEVATDGTPWYAERTEKGAVTVYTDDDESVYEDEHADLNDARYIATMHPGIGLALADWFDFGAAEVEKHPERAISTHVLRMVDLILGGGA